MFVGHGDRAGRQHRPAARAPRLIRVNEEFAKRTKFHLRAHAFGLCTAPMTVFLNGNFLPKDEASISPDDRGFLFGDGIYEVLKVYDGHLFRAESHWRRLRGGLEKIHLTGCDALDWSGICNDLVKHNQLTTGEAVVYLQITRGPAPRKHAFPANPTPTIYGFATVFPSLAEKRAHGYRAVTIPDERWLRCDIKSISLLGNVLANQAAADAGVDESILIRDGRVTEGSHSSFAAVFDGEIWTAPIGNLILPGITREVVAAVCSEKGWSLREEFIPEERLAGASEMMVWSTTAEVMPVVELNGQPVGDGRPGPITKRLSDEFARVIEHERGVLV